MKAQEEEEKKEEEEEDDKKKEEEEEEKDAPNHWEVEAIHGGREEQRMTTQLAEFLSFSSFFIHRHLPE